MRSPCVLAIECSTDCGSVALLRGGQCWQVSERLRDKHSQTLLPMIAEVLRQAGETRSGLTHIAAGIGPGSFTGVRTAVSVAQGMALGLGLQLIGIGGLDALALSVSTTQPARVLAALDARMHEVYAAVFDVHPAHAGVRAVQAPVVMHPAQISAWLEAQPQLCVGNAFAAYPGELAELAMGAIDGLPQAQHVAQLAVARIGQRDAEPVQDCQPLYVRNRVAATIAERRLLGQAA